MHLNNIAPSRGAKTKRTRVGRGMGSGIGKTCGRGHKGQKSRSGGPKDIKRGFEGGQMPYKQRLPKFGFKSKKSLTHAEIRLSELNKITDEIVDLLTLKKFNIITNTITNVKIFLSGKIDRSLIVRGIPVSKGAKAAIESAGGKIEN